MAKHLFKIAGSAILLLSAQVAQASVPADQAAKLGKELTPIGAEKAASADGLVPAWTPAQQHGKLSGEYAISPEIEGDKPIATITAANMDKYAAQLSEGHKYLL